MGQYRKKPVVVEAWQWTPPEMTDMPKWLLDAIEDSTCCCHSRGEAATMVVTINTLEGMMTAQPGDWIIQGVKGEIYPCKPDIFAATYDPAGAVRLPDMPHVEQMPPGARADAMRHDPEWRAQPIGASPPLAAEDYQHPNQRATRFRDEMQQVINSHSRENGSDTPDFILAQFVLDVMDAFDRAVTRRSGWYKPPGPIYDRIAELEAQLQQAHDLVLRTEGENTQLRGELQRVSMAGMTPSMVVGK